MANNSPATGPSPLDLMTEGLGLLRTDYNYLVALQAIAACQAEPVVQLSSSSLECLIRTNKWMITFMEQMIRLNQQGEQPNPPTENPNPTPPAQTS